MEQRRFIGREPEGWDGVEREGYVPGVETKVTRHTLIGHWKARPSDEGPSCEVRYFHLPPGGVSRLEKHDHEHFVIVGEGAGHAIVGTDVFEVKRHDVIYVGPMEPHQFVNKGSEPFGFFCMVAAFRDAPQMLSDAEIAELKASPAGAYIDPEGAPPPRPREAAPV